MINLGKWKNLEEVINYSLRVAKSKMKEAEKDDKNR
jgi:hypothetical protein